MKKLLMIIGAIFMMVSCSKVPAGQVEIKGYMREHSLIKWTWFSEDYCPQHNLKTELWDKKKLEEMGII